MFLVVLVHPADDLLRLALFRLGHRVAVDIVKHKLTQLKVGIINHRVAGDILRAVLDDGGQKRGNPLALGAAQNINAVVGKLFFLKNARAHRVLNVVVDISDLVTHPDQPPLQSGSHPVGVTGDAVLDFIGEVESPAVFFQKFDIPHAVGSVLKAVGADVVEHPFPRVAERGVAQIMAEGYRLGQVLVEPQPSRRCPRCV